MTLRELITSLPDAAAAVAIRDDAEAARLLNLPASTAPKPGSRLTELGLLDTLIMAHAVAGTPDPATAANNDLIAVETAAEALRSSALLSRALRILKDPAGQGLDFGNLSTQGMVLQLRGAVLTTVAADALLAYGSQSVSAAKAALGRDVTVDEISTEYAVERVDADNAAALAERVAAWELAKAAHAAAPSLGTATALERYTRELRQTLGGEEAIAAAEAQE